MLQARFPTADPEFLAAIERADAATLEELILHSQTETLAQVRARLGLDQA